MATGPTPTILSRHWSRKTQGLRLWCERLPKGQGRVRAKFAEFPWRFTRTGFRRGRGLSASFWAEGEIERIHGKCARTHQAGQRLLGLKVRVIRWTQVTRVVVITDDMVRL